MGSLLVFVSPCFKENLNVTNKIVSFLCVCRVGVGVWGWVGVVVLGVCMCGWGCVCG